MINIFLSFYIFYSLFCRIFSISRRTACLYLLKTCLLFLLFFVVVTTLPVLHANFIWINRAHSNCEFGKVEILSNCFLFVCLRQSRPIQVFFWTTKPYNIQICNILKKISLHRRRLAPTPKRSFLWLCNFINENIWRVM